MHLIFVAQSDAANFALAWNSKGIQARLTCLITNHSAQSSPIRDIPSDVSGRASAASGKTKGHCIRTLRKVADQTDAVLLVLDARDTTGAAASWSRRRCEVEDKRLVFVFNMIDPVPRENAQVFAEGPPPRDPNDAFPSWVRTNFSFGISPAISFTFWRCTVRDQRGTALHCCRPPERR
ncbi:hypothetical protein EDB92DRAFT_393152 [Lactarius akahatsu]|uniref:Uncharacterized protein n=1 Tax=Lactarius akahatsu TaxID=416441 RepID=A0AAD4L5S0_9AGAM|nr:hypothetical protein EDB92DRAFT_393152 [Lactarius akahatsu]